MERKIKLSIESGGQDDFCIWEDTLENNGIAIQTMTFKTIVPYIIRKQQNGGIYIHTHIDAAPFYITINPGENVIEYIQAKTYHEIKIVTSIKEGLCDSLIDHFSKVIAREERMAPIEFTDKETATDPVPHSNLGAGAGAGNQSAGKRRRIKKTRRHRRS